MRSLGDRIKKERQKRGWTQEVVATKAGISKGFLSDVENGKQRIGADNLLDLARVFGVSLDYLMVGKPEEESRHEIQIPGSLAKLAEEHHLSFRQTLALLDMRRQIVAHRKSSGHESDDKFDWEGFYRSIKGWLPDDQT